MNTVQEQIRWLELQANTWKYCPAAERAKFDAIKESLKSMQARIEVLEKVAQATEDYCNDSSMLASEGKMMDALAELKETP